MRSSPENQAALHTFSMKVLRLARPGVSRPAFAQAACSAILEFTDCTALEMWLDDTTLRYRAVAERRDGGEPAMELFREADGPAEGRRALIEQIAESDAGIAIREGRAAAGGCYLYGGGGLQGRETCIALIPFEVGSGHQGALLLKRPDGPAFDDRDLDCHLQIGQVLGLAVAHRRAHAALTERVKELTCMYRIARLSEDPDLSREQLLQATVEVLPPAWQHPELASARIRLDGLDFRSAGFRPGGSSLAADIVIRGQPRGFVEVIYSPNDGGAELGGGLSEDPFLPEEHSLVRAVARELSLIIERAHLHEQIRHADRLATIGQLAAGVAHELNEPLANILGFAQLAAKAPDLPSQPRADLDRIVQASLFAREVIRKLMLFARQTPSTMQGVSLNRVVDEGLYFLSARCAKEGVQVQLDLAPDLPEIHGDFSQIQQVLVNLVVNALQAMPQGGALQVRTYAEQGDVCLEVRDSGVGIEEDLQQRMFLPFVTTKEVGEGTGLGLSVVHGIVTAHRGQVRVSSKVGEGSRFQVRLPGGEHEGSRHES